MVPAVTRNRDQEHRLRPLAHSRNPEQLAGPRPVEQDAEVGNVPVGTDLLALDDDRGDDLVKRGIGERRRLRNRPLVALRP
jgi:hypothetical protein